MEFIDNLGHVFSLKTYDDDPVAIKYDEQEYVFWIKEDQISINNYYILPIKFLMSYDFLKELSDIYEEGVNEGFSLTIESDSNFYRLISPKTIQEKIEADNVQTLNDSIFFKADKDFTNKLDLSDFYFDIQNIDNSLIVYNEDKKYIMFPFYVVGYSKFEGTFLSNIMIKCNYSTNVQDVNPDNTPKTKTITASKEEYYDDLLKQTFDKIEIFEVNGPTETLVKTIYPEYKIGENVEYDGDVVEVEIITPHSNNQFFEGTEITRQRNFKKKFGFNLPRKPGYPEESFHVIFKFKEGEYLSKDKIYRFKCHLYQHCCYCESEIGFNHDGKYISDYLDYKRTHGNTDDIITKFEKETDEEHEAQWVECYGYDDQEQQYRYVDKRLKPDRTLTIDEAISLNIRPNAEEKTDVRDIWFDLSSKVTVTEDGVDEDRPVFKLATEYTPITIGGTFVDECEELIINGQNMGFRFPKDIVKAFYQSSIYNKTVDEKLLKDKMKELLLNYMGIRGECGNFNSMLKSLYWFGWGDKIEISKLLKTDNDFQDQYILDYFTIDNDLKYTYRFFNESNMVSLSLKENMETGIYNFQNWNADFVGEGNPYLENLFDKVEEVQHEHLTFYKPYYDFIFRELALKLDCLAYYYQTYFLPVHVKINRASIERKVYANDIKMSSFAFTKETPSNVYISNDDVIVEFPESNELLYYKTTHLIDSKFNEFSNYNNNYDFEDLYYVNENCITIPIKIIKVDSRYTQYDKGEYILIDSVHLKPLQYLGKDENDEYRETLPEYATHYKLSKYDEPTRLNASNRYVDISSYYFRCYLILSYTYRRPYKEVLQEYVDKYGVYADIDSLLATNNYRKYALIDDNYIYVDKLYNKFGLEDSSNNYIIYDGQLKFISDSNLYAIDYGILIDDDKFNFYQNINEYYRNLILVPRLFKKNIDWLKCEFKINMLVNNKWFEYVFTVKKPNIYLEFGKLYYRYFLKDNKTMFKQILSINGNDIHFNSFMYQPDLVSINSLFLIDKNDETNNLMIEVDGQNKKVLSFLEKLKTIYDASIEETQKEIDNLSIETEEIEQKRQELQELYDKQLMREFYSQYYRGKITIPYNKKYYNKIHIFELYKDDVKLEYDNNPKNIELYTLLFPELHSYEFAIQINEIPDYDAYLMHDEYEEYNIIEINENNLKLSGALQYGTIKVDGEHYTQEEIDNAQEGDDAYEKTIDDWKIEPIYYTKNDIDEHNRNLEGALKPGDLKHPTYWYIVLISRYPVYYNTEEELKIHQSEYTYTNYSIKYSGFSLEKPLVNRMDIIKANGMNHFNDDDLVIVTLTNDNQLFNIDLHEKWEIKHINDLQNITKVNANPNIMIIQNNNYNNMYTKGYYNVLLNYTIDGLNNYEYRTIGNFRINKEYEDNLYPVLDDKEIEKDYFIPIEDEYWEEIPETRIYAEIDGEIKEIYINPQSGQSQQLNKISSSNLFGNNIKDSRSNDQDAITYKVTQQNIRKIIIGTNIQEINNSTFNGISNPNGCEIYISSTVSKINIAFAESASMITTFKVHPDNEWFDSRGNCNAIILTNDDLNKEHLVYGNHVYLKNTMVRGCANTAIPNTVEDFADHIFCSVAKLPFLDTGNHVKYIGHNAIWNMPDLERLTLGSNIEKIYYYSGLTYNDKLKTIRIRAKVPPQAVESDGNTIYNGSIEISEHIQKIYVEPGCEEVYKNHPSWSNFTTKIQEAESEF